MCESTVPNQALRFGTPAVPLSTVGPQGLYLLAEFRLPRATSPWGPSGLSLSGGPVVHQPSVGLCHSKHPTHSRPTGPLLTADTNRLGMNFYYVFKNKDQGIGPPGHQPTAGLHLVMSEASHYPPGGVFEPGPPARHLLAESGTSQHQIALE